MPVTTYCKHYKIIAYGLNALTTPPPHRGTTLVPICMASIYGLMMMMQCFVPKLRLMVGLVNQLTNTDGEHNFQNGGSIIIIDRPMLPPGVYKL